MSRRLKYIVRLLTLVTAMISLQTACSLFSDATGFAERMPNHTVIIPHEEKIPDSVSVLVGTFLGNDKRNYYGDSAPERLDVIWKLCLGSGTTIVSAKKGIEEWSGAGWTGQPLVVREKDKTFLLQGAFDHHLKKIDAASGKVIWQYAYDDIIKGTGTIWVNDSAKDPMNRVLILQGSRKGVQNAMCAPKAESFRAVSYFTGKEAWRMNVEHTASYSRDCDASALILRDTAYIGLENGKFLSFDPGREVNAEDTTNHPRIFEEHMLYAKEDAAKHGGNLVTESSPARIGNHIYVTAGSGHVYGYNLDTREIDWDFYIGSDMDGSPVVTSDSCILVEVEKQYIAGKGGVFKLNPRKTGNDCVDWYYPTGDFNFSSWEGGVIGSASVNDNFNPDGMFPHMAAFTGIDGYLTVVRYDRVRKDTTVAGPDGKTMYNTPFVLFRSHTGSSISTPIFVQEKLIAAGYGGINLFSYNRAGMFFHQAFHPGIFETTPVADHGKIYAASRDGYLYCFGDTMDGKIPAVFAKHEPKIFKDKKAVDPFNRQIVERYYLIAGAFRVKSNAEKVQRDWQNKGVSATLVHSDTELYYVSIASALTPEGIQASDETMQRKFGVDGWVYKK